MKDKIVRAVAIATVTIISSALVAYLRDPKNRLAVQKGVKKYRAQAKKYAKKATKQFKAKVKEYKL